MSSSFLFYGELLVRLLPEDAYATHLEALAEALPFEVAATDQRGRVIVWNAALAAVTTPREQALGRPLLEALPALRDDPNVKWSTLLAQVLAGEGNATFARLPMGERVVRANLGPIRGKGGAVLGAVLALEDVTLGAREAE